MNLFTLYRLGNWVSERLTNSVRPQHPYTVMYDITPRPVWLLSPSISRVPDLYSLLYFQITISMCQTETLGPVSRCSQKSDDLIYLFIETGRRVKGEKEKAQCYYQEMDKRNPGFMQFTRNPSDLNYPKPEKKLGWLPHPSPGCHTLQLSGLKLFPCSSFHSHSSLLFMFSSTWSYLSCRSPNDGCMHWGFPAAVPVPPPCYPSSMSIHSFSHSLIISMPPPSSSQLFLLYAGN